jgi:hypothetical protein
MVVQQHCAVVAAGGHAPKRLDATGILLDVSDAFGLCRRKVDCFDDVANRR